MDYAGELSSDKNGVFTGTGDLDSVSAGNTDSEWSTEPDGDSESEFGLTNSQQDGALESSTKENGQSDGSDSDTLECTEQDGELSSDKNGVFTGIGDSDSASAGNTDSEWSTVSDGDSESDVG